MGLIATSWEYARPLVYVLLALVMLAAGFLVGARTKVRRR
jgi:hypothetical protein